MSNEALAVAYQGGDRDMLPALWAQVEKLAVVMVRRYINLAHQNRAADFDDLMQSAFLAVERAAGAFREGEGSFAAVMTYYVKSEIAALLGLRGRIRREHYEAVSADAPMYEEGTTCLADTLADDSLPDHCENLEREAIRQEVQSAIDRLPDDQAAVVRG